MTQTIKVRVRRASRAPRDTMDAMPPVTVRVMRRDEMTAMRAVSIAAFDDDQSIGTLIDALASSWAWDDQSSFVAEVGGRLVGQVLFTHAILDAPARLVDVLVLSPIGVLPEFQHQGVGSALITGALRTIGQRDEPLVFLEGHPTYYPRFGFRPAGPLGFTAPSVRIPAEAFMVLRMPSHEPWMTGQLVYPDAFWRTDSVGLRPPR